MATGALRAVAAASAAGLMGASLWSLYLYRAFDHKGKRRLSREIIEGVAAYVRLPDQGVCLDVGCGSGALAIEVAKRNPRSTVFGIDRRGREYASFTRDLCERNADAEGVENVRFEGGDATALGFADETFDAVCSNYVYHNIRARDRTVLLRETLRTLKRGGSFAIHDIFSPHKYGDMDGFVRALREEGYERVELIETADGMWITRSEARTLGLAHSALLVGVK